MNIQRRNDKKITTIKNFVFSIYNAESLKLLLSFTLAAFAAVLMITSLYSVFRQRDEEITTSTIITDDNRLIKGWKMTPDLASAIEAGDISLKGITVVEKGGDIQFNGGDSDKIVIIDYRTEIEDNKAPQIYSDKYFEELKKEGKNTYVVRIIGLTTEATTNEGAE